MKLLSLLFTVVTTATSVAGCGKLELYDTGIVLYPSGPKSPCRISAMTDAYLPELIVQLQSFSNKAIEYDLPCYGVEYITITNDGFKEEATTIGVCRPQHSITLRTDFWQVAGPKERLALVYHELGHCALHMGHHDTAPDIMNSTILDESFLKKDWDNLVKEMFNRARKETK